MSKLSELIKILKTEPDLVDSMLQDWDYNHLLYIMEWKLARMEKSQRNGRHIGCEKEAKDIQIAKNLLHRIQNDDYMSKKYEDLLESRWQAKKEIDLPTGNVLMEFEDNPQQDRILDIERKRTAALEAHDWNYLFKILQRKMRRWWN